MKHKIKVFIEKLQILKWKIKNRKMKLTSRRMLNNLKELKEGEKYGIWKNKRTYFGHRRIS